MERIGGGAQGQMSQGGCGNLLVATERGYTTIVGPPVGRGLRSLFEFVLESGRPMEKGFPFADSTPRLSSSFGSLWQRGCQWPCHKQDMVRMAGQRTHALDALGATVSPMWCQIETFSFRPPTLEYSRLMFR